MDAEKPTFRFAPSPNGRLHLGHALSAILNHDMAKAVGGRFLLRIEDIDPARSNADNERSICEDLEWLGLSWELPVRRQSEHIGDYAAVLERLNNADLVYPAFLTRGEIRAHAENARSSGQLWPSDPDGSPLYPDVDRNRDRQDTTRRLLAGARHSWRLDLGKSMTSCGGQLFFVESGGNIETIEATPAVWGDVVLWRSDAPSSYHLSVVVDDAIQGVTHVVRGQDLAMATHLHRLLQAVIGLPAPLYHHHRLVLGPDGRKLSKSVGSTSLASLRRDGVTPLEIRRLLGVVEGGVETDL